MRLLICAGGSGGGVYPALAVLQAAGESVEQVLWVGGDGMEVDLVEREGIPLATISAAGLHGVGLGALPGNILNLIRGYGQARRVIREFEPDVLMFTGGYIAGPVAAAARGIPKLVYVPDIEPGLALKLVGRFATRIALIAEESRKFFSNPAKLVVTGHPTRAALQAWSPKAARQEFGLLESLPVLLVFGGSKGARSINLAVMEHLKTLLESMQVLHVTGTRDWPVVEEFLNGLSDDLSARYRPVAYIHETMGAAYAAADLILARSGASAVGEFPLFGVPAILVPYPHAWRYQKVNADYLVRHGAAVVLPDDRMSDDLLSTVTKMMDDAGLREKMGEAMGKLAHPEAAQSIAQHLEALARGGSS